ncbi:MAG: hypothetical protein ACREGR_04975 [Minisyncoccia bacterium]
MTLDWQDDLTDAQVGLMCDARLYETEFGGEWYEHGQQGRSAPGLVARGLVEFRPASGSVGNYVAPAIRLTAEGRERAQEVLDDPEIKAKGLLLMNRRLAYIQRNLRHEGKIT